MPQMPPVQASTEPTVPTNLAATTATLNARATVPKENKTSGVLGVVLSVVFLLVAATFAGLFIWSRMEYSELETNVNLKVEAAVSEAKTEQALADAEEAKKDTRTFTGPTDYGQLSFDYPKSWSVYVASDASKGGNFVSYFNPIEISPVSDTTVYALRLTIEDRSFESVVQEYQRYLDRGEMSVETTTVGGATANRYTGKLLGTELNGVVVIFKIRDKTAILRTDSELLVKDFDTVLSTVKFNA